MTICIILLMLALNAILAAYEMALASISRTKIAVLFQENHSGAQAALFMKDHLEGSLAVVQIGITLAGAIAAAMGGAGAESAFQPFLNSLGISGPLAHAVSIACVVLPLSFMTIVFSELVPKTYAIKNKEWVVLKLSPVMRVIYACLSPVVTVMEKIVRLCTHAPAKTQDPKTAKKAALTDLRTAAAIASSSRLFTQTEEKMVLAAAQFCVRTIAEIQVPLAQVYFLNADDSIADTFLKAHLDMHTRFPVLENPQDPQSIIGYLNFKDIFSSTKTAGSAHTSTRSIVRPIFKLEDDTLISTALQKLMANKQHICLVTDDGKTTGILTLEDIFEELVGEIEDEYDFSLAYIRPFGESYLVSASANMSEVFSTLGLPVPAGVSPTMTVTQWVDTQLNRTPTKNEKINAGGLILETRKFRRHKLVEALVTKAEK